jgi:dethiobiotin synthetase
VDVARAVDGFHHLAARYDHVLVEGAGGWEVPLVTGRTVGDLAADLALPVVVVVDNRLGGLNHTILTVNAIRARGLDCAGLILNHLADERDTASITNRAILEDWLQVPVLQDILHQESETDADWILEFLGK